MYYRDFVLTGEQDEKADKRNQNNRSYHIFSPSAASDMRGLADIRILLFRQRQNGYGDKSYGCNTSELYSLQVFSYRCRPYVQGVRAS